ncbi:sulfurtransferase TusA family protein [Natronococcus wangiae]|uniref:sulfurtransferase TusA family protein n=1 Tax=Natronococcus wangiae TaxID=3068275 RepID=UPI00273FB057|nr:sulfurtransferase TusA family protein [Natronococcus sp. AD5]
MSVVRRCLEELDPGDELVVSGDYPPAERSIFRTCCKHGYAVTTAPDEGDGGTETFTLRIRVTERAARSTSRMVSHR